MNDQPPRTRDPHLATMKGLLARIGFPSPLDGPGAGALHSTEAETGRDRPLSSDDLERIGRAVLTSAFFVAPRIMKRVIRNELGEGLFGASIGSRAVHVLPFARAVEYLDRDELGLADGVDPPENLILIERTDPEVLERRPRAEVLTQLWRSLFLGRLRSTLEERRGRGELGPSQVRDRIIRIGELEFDEVRTILTEDRSLRDPRDLTQVYLEFVATYTVLRQFTPLLLPDWFPSLRDPVRIDLVIQDDVDVIGLLNATRPEGVPDLAPAEPIIHEAFDEDIEPTSAEDEAPRVAALLPAGSFPPVEDEAPRVLSGRAQQRYAQLRSDAYQAERKGNLVRAAVSREKAAQLLPAELQPGARREAQRVVERLARRVGVPLELRAVTLQSWVRALPTLLEGAARGRWAPEARLLYELQKIAVEHGREIYKIDAVAWLFSGGRRPLKRPLPFHREVSSVNHLRAALKRLRRTQLGEPDRERLARLLHEALEQAKQRLRDRFRPRLTQSLDAQCWDPANIPEAVAREKMIEELLDRVVESGFLVMGDLRDAVSRNDLKLPDLGPSHSSRANNRLLATDRALAVALDGVYRRGEVYLRWLQSFSALLFGTPRGRWITRAILLPFGGAYVALKGHDYLIEEFAHVLHVRPYHLFHWSSLFVLAIFLEGILHSSRFRAGAWSLWGRARRAIYWLFVTLPRKVVNLPAVRLIFSSRAFQRTSRWVLRPLLSGLAVLVALSWFGARAQDARLGALATFLVTVYLLNSRPGRDLEEILADRVDHVWRRVIQEWAVGLYHLIMELFGRILSTFERFLYMIDEWLRFRGGQDRGELIFKAVLGVIWSGVTSIVRFAVNLVIEPQVNPIKHFPVVTVAHKVMLPLLIAVKSTLSSPALGLSAWTVWLIAGLVQFVPPGIVGFLVWEFKENWRLYRSNRPTNLGPVIVGHHGETMARLLRPGFHSGTLPRAFSRLRRADGKHWRRTPSRKPRETIDRAIQGVHHFAERELIALLASSRALAGLTFTVGGVVAGANRVQIAVQSSRDLDHPLIIVIEEQSGWIVAGVRTPGWVDRLSEAERGVIRDALAGLYKRAGVDLVREQIERDQGASTRPHGPCTDGRALHPDSHDGSPIHAPSPQAVSMIPPTGDGLDPNLAITDANCFSKTAITWTRWVEIWTRDQRGDGHPVPVVPTLILPAPPAAPATNASWEQARTPLIEPTRILLQENRRD